MENLGPLIKYLVIGNPISHSKSPQMQNAAFLYYNLGEPYGKIKLEPEDLPEFVAFARKHLMGFNITVPYKELIIPLLDEIDESARQASSVNTVLITNGKLKGFSTDGYGLEQAIKNNFKIDIVNNSFLFIGVGGAAQAVAWHFAKSGAKKLFLANRTIEKAELLAKKIRHAYPNVEIITFKNDDKNQLSIAIKSANTLIQATSLGLKPNDINPFDFELLKLNPQITVIDLIYHQTSLLAFAENNNITYACGKDMLVYQGARAFFIWTKLSPPINLMSQALEI